VPSGDRTCSRGPARVKGYEILREEVSRPALVMDSLEKLPS
jgi:hypothetical protein